MDTIVMDETYQSLGIVDMYESNIWTDRYNSCGDFELFMPVGMKALDLLVQGRYLHIQKSDRYMIIETIEIKSDLEDGGKLTVTGRSLESILDRRVIWGQEVATDDTNLQTFIQLLITKNVISPYDPDRAIPNFSFQMSADPRITALTINAQFLGENLYSSIETICQVYGLGFRVLPVDGGGFVFSLYMGIDRSYSQTNVPPVIFSQKFDNLLSSNYFSSTQAYKTVALIVGEGEGSNRMLEQATIDAGGGIGLNRREIFVDGSIVSSTTDDGELTEAQYREQLVEYGKEELSPYTITTAFEGQIDATRQFVYGQDFFLGDIVQVVDEYGKEARARVSEVVQTSSTTEKSMIPTFTPVE